MAYFNHAFQKCFLGTGLTRDDGTDPAGIDVGVESPTNPYSTQGFITTSLSPTSALATAGPGYFGMYSKDTYLALADADLASAGCCPLVLASASLKSNDKQGPFHGGYQESNKSKYINPRLIREFYRVDECTAQQHIVHVGSTNFTVGGAVLTIDTSVLPIGTLYTDGTWTDQAVSTSGSGSGMTVDVTIAGGIITAIAINNPGSGYAATDTITLAGADSGAGNDDGTFDILTVDAADSDCCKAFMCGETYYMEFEVKGSPALRFANHNLYQTFQADGGCCPTEVPTEVDSTLIYIQWATQIVESEYLKDFIQVVVFDEAGNPWFATAALAEAAGWPATQIWSNYVSAGHTDGDCGGMRLMGAYVDTVFGNCSFEVSDHFEKEPIKILASEVDYKGDPCAFNGLCVVEECPPLQGMGYGETVVRDLIVSESYLQNFFASNSQRIREITQGYDILNSVTRGSLYTRYYILHSVPRFNNPTGTFDNDQYMLEVITNGTNAAFETFMDTWLTGCGDGCASLETQACTPCTPLDLPVAP
jgi:hypothetical protein